MASNNFKLFDENKVNMLSSPEYQNSQQRLNGVQQGIASSLLQNKTLYQVSLVAYALGQMVMNNGLDASDDIAVSTFVGNVSNSILQKVVDKATQAEAELGTDTTKWITPATARAAVYALKATDAEVAAGSDNTHWITSANWTTMYNNKRASTSEAEAGRDDVKFITPYTLKIQTDSLYSRITNETNNKISNADTFSIYINNEVIDTDFRMVGTFGDGNRSLWVRLTNGSSPYYYEVWNHNDGNMLFRQEIDDSTMNIALSSYFAGCTLNSVLIYPSGQVNNAYVIISLKIVGNSIQSNILYSASNNNYSKRTGFLLNNPTTKCFIEYSNTTGHALFVYDENTNSASKVLDLKSDSYVGFGSNCGYKSSTNEILYLSIQSGVGDFSLIRYNIGTGQLINQTIKSLSYSQFGKGVYFGMYNPATDEILNYAEVNNTSSNLRFAVNVVNATTATYREIMVGTSGFDVQQSYGVSLLDYDNMSVYMNGQFAVNLAGINLKNPKNIINTFSLRVSSGSSNYISALGGEYTFFIVKKLVSTSNSNQRQYTMLISSGTTYSVKGFL